MVLAASAARAAVVVNEIMYHPVELPAFDAAGDPLVDLSADVHEYLDLHNSGTVPVSLAGWRLRGGIDYRFADSSTIPADGYLVIARDPLRLQALPAYALAASRVEGPWQGHLKNGGDSLRLEDAAGHVVDAVSYSSTSPWAIGANAFGAGSDWTGVAESAHQYRGRSLERVATAWASNDPANWVASPIGAGPSPGRPNAIRREAPLPVVLEARAVPENSGLILIRSSQPVRVEARFSTSGAGVSTVQVEYFKDDINSTSESKATAAMAPAPGGYWRAVLPGQANRSVVRYRIRADRGDGLETVSPRPDDPQAWHAYFVSPLRSTTRPAYDVLISSSALATLAANISGTPRRVVNPDPPGQVRASWNADQPAVLVRDGQVFDVRMRHHGSRYRRDASRNSFKFQFPDYAKLDGSEGLFLKDKGEEHRVAALLYQKAGLPAFRARYADLYLNSGSALPRLEVPEMDGAHFEKFALSQAAQFPGTPVESTGEFYKSTGVVPYETSAGMGGTSLYSASGEGPYFIGNAAPIPAKLGWTSRQRYAWTYGAQMHSWIGGRDTEALILDLWSARGDTPLAPRPDLPALRTWLGNHFDVDATLTYIAVRNWCAPVDDVTHNHFLWRRANGRWGLLPWDLDGECSNSAQSIYWDEYAVPQPDTLRGPHWIKDSFLKAYRDEYRQKLWLLNHTVLLPENFGTQGYGGLQSFAVARHASVNNQLQLGSFYRPLPPALLAPSAGASVLPGAILQASPYAHAGPAPAHLSTTWTIRPAGGSWDAPVFRTTSRTQLTALPLPFGDLVFGQTYFWKCSYTDADGHPSQDSAERSFSFGGSSGSVGDVRLSEVQARGPGDDFVELHNASALPAELSGMGLTDDPTQGPKFTFPPGSVLGAGAYRVVPLGAAAPFRLNGDGQTVILLDRDGLLADAVSFGPQAAARSLGRGPSGWELAQPSPGAPHLPESLGAAAALRLNEWMASDPQGPDWLEITNLGPSPVALAGLRLGAGTESSALPPLSFIAPGGFQRFFADRAPGPAHLGFKLNSGGESLSLLDSSGALIDSLTFGPQAAGVSQGRLPDGASAVQSFPGQSSPGDPNALAIEDVTISRVYPGIALYNRNATAVVLDGWQISPALPSQASYTFPPGFGALAPNSTRTIGAAELPFPLNALRGGELFLTHHRTHRLRRAYGAWDGHPWGLVGDFSTGDFVRVHAFPETPPNVPVVGPIVVSEINYHPPDLPGADDSYEFVEWYNSGSLPVDLSGWKLAGSAHFTLPDGVHLPSGGRLVIGAVSPRDFAARYEVAPDALIFGPWNGGLPNDSGDLRLVSRLPAVSTEGPDFGFHPELPVEAITYGDAFPWSPAPDGTGATLQRDPAIGYGNTASSWFDGPPSPGRAPSPNLLPIISILTPTPDLRAAAGMPIAIEISASDPDGAVKQVRLEVDGVTVGAASAPPWIFSWTSQTAGRHALRATAWDGRLAGAAVEFSLSLTNDPPRIALLAPSAWTRPAEGVPIVLEAAAFDPESNLARVEFLADGNVVGTASLPPWRTFWTGAASGHHRVAARAFDRIGLWRESSAMDLFVVGLAPSEPVIAYRVPAGTVGLQNYGGSLGHDFEVLRPIALEKLGVFDSGSNGLSSTLTSQLWRSQPSPQLLASLSFTAAAPGALAAGSSNRFKALAAPLILPAGHYTAVAYGYSAAEPNGNAGTGNSSVWTAHAGGRLIRFTGSGRYGSAGLYPSTPDGGPADRYAGPTFAFSDADADGDGMPLDWELAQGFNPADPADGAADSDGDGSSNRDECAVASNPRDPSSAFSLHLGTLSPAPATLRLALPANCSAALQGSDSLIFWEDLQNIPAAPAARVLDLAVPTTGRHAYFRAVANP